jgi:DNA polymerase III delta subunit
MNVIDLDASTLDADPARLAEEADSIAMFGGRKTVIARLDDPKGLVKPVEALLSSTAARCHNHHRRWRP